MHVRAARAEDRGRLLTIWERSVRATHHFLHESDIVALRPLVAEELAGDAVGWWVLVSAAAEPIGFLGFARDTIEGLFIDPDHHGRGGGRLLVAHAQRLAAGALAVDVNEQNVAAVRFYEALGFSVLGRSPTDEEGRPFPILHMHRASNDTDQMATIAVHTGDAPELEAFLVERIYEYNAAATGYHDGESFSATRRNDAGDIEAGIYGYTWGGCCYVSYLWVSEAVRGRGLGSELLDAAERHARERRCRVVFLSTHSFQAPGFYARRGYEPVARVSDHPVGHASLYYAKRLDGP